MAIAVVSTCREVSPVVKAQGSDDISEPTTLGKFWPIDALPRTWSLVSRNAANAGKPHVLMSVTNEVVRPGVVMLWFFNKAGQKSGEKSGELYRLCETPPRKWLFLEGYTHFPFVGRLDHPVTTDKAILSLPDGVQVDLIADGEYLKCGSSGQPYLLWSPLPARYRLQIWGHLEEHQNLKWYWDASVRTRASIIDDCLSSSKQMEVVEVRESWWNNFSDHLGSWELGSGEIDRSVGQPTGRAMTYGRAVWHGEGQLPYLMTGKIGEPDEPTWCVNEILPGSGVSSNGNDLN